MKPRLSTKRNAAMTLLEVLIVITVIAILVALLPPVLAAAQKKAQLIACNNHLKNIFIGFRVWGSDHENLYPMGVSTNFGGTLEYVATGTVFQHFKVMSNELSTPEMLVCPADTRRPAKDFQTTLSNANISYFVGVDVTNDLNPQMIFFGDCNFEIGGVPVKSGLRSFWTNDPVAWSAARHVLKGNICLADGSVQPTISTTLQNYLQQTGLATNRFAIP